jgi:hypothetical protein
MPLILRLARSMSDSLMIISLACHGMMRELEGMAALKNKEAQCESGSLLEFGEILDRIGVEFLHAGFAAKFDLPAFVVFQCIWACMHRRSAWPSPLNCGLG